MRMMNPKSMKLFDNLINEINRLISELTPLSYGSIFDNDIEYNFIIL